MDKYAGKYDGMFEKDKKNGPGEYVRGRKLFKQQWLNDKCIDEVEINRKSKKPIINIDQGDNE